MLKSFSIDALSALIYFAIFVKIKFKENGKQYFRPPDKGKQHL